MAAEVRIEGLVDFRRALKSLGGEYPKRIGQINKRAGESIAREAATRYGRVFTSRTGRAQRAIKSRAQQRSAVVSSGSPSLFKGANGWKVPFGQEFGGEAKKFGGSHTGTTGRFLYPSARDKTPEIVDAYLEELDDLAGEAFPRG